MSPDQAARGKVRTWVTSQWKLCASRVSSQWKSTGGAFDRCQRCDRLAQPSSVGALAKSLGRADRAPLRAGILGAQRRAAHACLPGAATATALFYGPLGTTDERDPSRDAAHAERPRHALASSHDDDDGHGDRWHPPKLHRLRGLGRRFEPAHFGPRCRIAGGLRGWWLQATADEGKALIGVLVTDVQKVSQSKSL
jgi:hypothetical protein